MRDLETLIPGDRGRHSPPLAAPVIQLTAPNDRPPPPDSWPRAARPQDCG